ncbi:MAG: DUF2586 family protein [Capnocytophaga sp.]|nr:DUF2586 family protein [Capnocytophaga sp.]
MALPKVLFNIAKDGLGYLTEVGGKTAGLIVTGVTVQGKIQLGKSQQIFSFKEAQALGISEDGNEFAYKHIKEFYDIAPTGTPLWLMLVSDTTTMTQMLDKEGSFAPQLIAESKGSIRVLGVVKKATSNDTVTAGLDKDVQTAVVKAQALADHFEEKHTPFRVVVSGNSWNGKHTDLTDYTKTQYNKVACLLANSDKGKDAAVGLMLGRITTIPVQRKIHRVKDGSVLPLEAYFTDGTAIDSRSEQWDAIDEKGYIFFRTFAGRSGYFFSSDRTLTQPTDAFKSLSNGFVMDKAVLIAYGVLVEKLSDEIPLSEDGTIHPAIIKNWQTDLESQIERQMVSAGELSAVDVKIAPNQNVVSTGKVIVNIQLLPVGYADFIEVNIGFTTSIE